MPNARRDYTPAEELALTTQVGGHCPLCDEPLFYEKGRRSFKGYELAHIYPLNPTATEEAILAGVSRLHPDVNHPNNIMALCTKCHPKFDKPRTLPEYNDLFAIKKRLLDEQAHRALNSLFPLEREISKIVRELHAINVSDAGVELALDPRRMDDKFDATMPPPVRRKVRNNVADYYSHVKHLFAELERDDPNCSELIFTQVKAFYLKQRSLGLPQSAIFSNVVNWIRSATASQTLEAAEIIASFFVQNCEVLQ